jgi:large subunit ribosomal protein L5
MAVAEAKIKPRLKTRYEQEIAPRLRERFGYKSPMQTPRLVKITLNMGVGDAKQDTNMLQAATEQLQTIAGQRPNVRRARKSIANFKLREEMPVGVAVTLRDARMWEFLDRLTSVAIPRIRDFRGLNPRAFDGRGNYNVGIREQIIFPEIDYDSVDQVRGLDINIATTATTDEEAFALLTELGMPFRRDESGDGPTAAEIRAEQEAKAKAEAEQAALAQLKEENPEAYAKPAAAPEAEGDEAVDTPAEPDSDQENQ